LKVKEEKVHLEVESSTSWTRWRQMVALEWYNYGIFGCHALVGILQENRRNWKDWRRYGKTCRIT